MTVGLIMGIGIASPRAAAAEAEGGVASINQCADQIALALGPPPGLRAVSRLVDETPSGATAPDTPRISGTIDSVLGLGVATVLMGPEGRGRKGELLRGFAVEVVVLDPPGSLEGLALSVERAGTALGVEAQARDLAARLRRVAERDVPRTAPRALWLAPNLMAMGPGTLSHSMLTAAGWRGGLPDGEVGWVRLSLERVLRSDADLVLLTAPDGQSRAEALLRHPALNAALDGRLRMASGGLGCDPLAVLHMVRDLASWRAGGG